MSNFTSVRLEITSQCNLNCKYCHNLDYSNKPNDMDYETIRSLIFSLKNDQSVNKVLLTGGEPLMNPHVVDIVKLLTELNIKSDLVTNGKLLTEDMIHELDQAGLKRIRISIDGIGDEHDRFRKGSSAPELWEKCKYIKANTNINTVVHTVSSAHNAKEMFDIYMKVLEVNADRWRVFDVGYEGAANQNLEELNIAKYYQEFMSQFSKILEHYLSSNLIDALDIEANGVFKTNLIKNPPIFNSINERDDYYKKILDLSPCAYIQHQSTIRSDGTGTLCQFFHNNLYDYKKYDYDVLKTIENKNSYEENEVLLNQVEHCKECKYVVVCNSGCRAKAKYLTGSVYKPDPVFCVLLPLLYKDIVPLFPLKAREAFESFLIQDGKLPLYNSKSLSELIQKKLGER